MSTTRSIVALALGLLMGAVQAPVLAQTGSDTEVEVEVPTPPGAESATAMVGGATLYQRLGGYDVIAKAVDDFLERMGKEESLQRLLEPLSEADLRRVRQNTVDFLCENTGGPCFYTGQDIADMDKAHGGMGVTAEDWERATGLMATTLDASGVQGELRDELGGFIAGLRDAIVEQE